MLRATLALSLLVLVACDRGAATTKPTPEAEAARPAEPVEPAEPAAPPSPEPPAKPAFMNEPERLNPAGQPWADHERRTIDVAGLPRRGKDTAKVVIVGCIDMRDAFNRRGQKAIAEVFAAYPDDLALYLRPYWNILESSAAAAKNGHKPAIESNNLTKLLARALVAADQQGKIWEMHDLILAAERDTLTRDSLAGMAATAGLDVAKWKAALDSKTTEAAVNEHRTSCIALGVDKATPINFVNGRLMRGGPKAEVFRYVIEVELAGGFELLPKP